MQIGLDQMDGQGGENERSHPTTGGECIPVQGVQRAPGLWLQNPQGAEIYGTSRMHENHSYMAGLGRLAPVFPFCPKSVVVIANILF